MPKKKDRSTATSKPAAAREVRPAKLDIKQHTAVELGTIPPPYTVDDVHALVETLPDGVGQWHRWGYYKREAALFANAPKVNSGGDA